MNKKKQARMFLNKQEIDFKQHTYQLLVSDLDEGFIDFVLSRWNDDSCEILLAGTKRNNEETKKELAVLAKLFGVELRW